MKHHVHAGLAGFFKFEAVRPDGTRRLLADWFENLITNIGLDRVGQAGTGTMLGFCRVGTGAVAPTNTDTQLGAQIASTSTEGPGATSGAAASAPYYGWGRIVYRFGAGVAAGNLTEVGVGWASSGATLFSRSLIKDGGGVPTTITVLGDEILDVTYELRCYAQSADTVEARTVDGVATTVTTRASVVTGWVVPIPVSGTKFPGITFAGSGDGGQPVAYSGNATLGAVTATPTAAAQTASNISTSFAAYVDGTYYRECTYSATIDHVNLALGIGALFIGTTWTGHQVLFAPALAKDNTKIFSMTFRISWARRP